MAAGTSSRDGPGCPGQKRGSEGERSDSWAPDGGSARLPGSVAGNWAAPWPPLPCAAACLCLRSPRGSAFLSSSAFHGHSCPPPSSRFPCLRFTPPTEAAPRPNFQERDLCGQLVRWPRGRASSGEGCAQQAHGGHGARPRPGGPAGCGQFLEMKVSLRQTPSLKFADSNSLRDVKESLLQQGQRPPPAPLPKR